MKERSGWKTPWRRYTEAEDKNMRAVLQRVSAARVTVQGVEVGAIGPGLLVYLGVGQNDTEQDARYLADKIADLRIFRDIQDKMNLSVQDVGGAVLVVSQFTLYGDCRKGRRPGFDQAAGPELGKRLYEYVTALLREKGLETATGIFGAHMQVTSINDGPVTILLESLPGRSEVPVKKEPKKEAD